LAGCKGLKTITGDGHGRMIRVTCARIVGVKGGARVNGMKVWWRLFMHKEFRAQLFFEISQRNALRKRAQLPLLDMRFEMAKGMNVKAWKEYYKNGMSTKNVTMRL
jgi:hypothetical protein